VVEEKKKKRSKVRQQKKAGHPRKAIETFDDRRRAVAPIRLKPSQKLVENQVIGDVGEIS